MAQLPSFASELRTSKLANSGHAVPRLHQRISHDSSDLVDQLAGKLIVSCQDYTQVMVKAAVKGGASGLRINSPRDVRAAKQMTTVPVIACNKMHFPNSPIYITPSVRSALAVVRMGAEIVALDCTNRYRVRQRPVEIIAAIHEAGALTVADLSCIEEAEHAIDAGADILATTLAPAFDLEFVCQLATLGLPVLAEGHIDRPDDARRAIDMGAWAVCVGSAITRPHQLTRQFVEAVSRGT